MEQAPPPEQPLNVKALTDEQLLKLFPVRGKEQEPAQDLGDDQLTIEDEQENRQKKAVARLTITERQAIEELWERYSKSVERYLRYKVYQAGSTLCPRQEPSQEHFATMAVHETYLRLLTSVSNKPFRKSFHAYFRWLAKCAALDLRKSIAKKRGSAPPPVEIVPLADRDIPSEPRMLDELLMLHRLRDVLDNYAAESLENAFSVKVARLKRADGMTWEETLAKVEELFARRVIGSTPGARMKRLRDFEKHDTKSLLPRLREYGITDPTLFDVLLRL